MPNATGLAIPVEQDKHQKASITTDTMSELYKLLAVSTEKQVNIGDYIQALAAAQFLPKTDGFIQREKLKDYDGERCKVIMNGWYMHHTEQWPPSEKITPLFVAFHINASAKEGLVSKGSIDYLKRFQPVGCRDYHTRDLLLSKGVDAYFSACLTLTLGMRYKSDEKKDKCYFVDPFIPKKRKVIDEIYNTFWLLTHYKKWNAIEKITDKLPYKKNFKRRIRACRLYRTYIKIFTEETLTEAEYISQRNKNYLTRYNTDMERLDEAKRLVNKYAKARMVVTSRIHCALPCLGLETPVIFTENTAQTEKKVCRMGGISDLFNTISFNGNRFETNFKFCRSTRISKKNVPTNKNLWRQYATKLIETCKDFINKNN